MNEEEKKALAAELLVKTKAALALEGKAEIEGIQKLILDWQKKNDAALEGLITPATLKEYEEKSEKAEKLLTDKIEKLETKMERMPIGAPGKDGKVPKEGADEYKAAFIKFLFTGQMPLEGKAEKHLMEYKALVSDTTGQILIPEELETEIYRVLPEINKIRGLATIRPTIRTTIRNVY